MPPRPLALFALMGLVLPLAAQTKVYLPSNTPGTGRMNLAPLGGKATSGSSQNMRTQVLVPRALLPTGGSRIQELAFCSSSVGSYKYQSLTIQLAHLKGTSFTTKFADNLAGAQTVLSAKVYALGKADSWSYVKLDKPFDHDGKRDLVIDIVIQGARYTGLNGASIAGSRRSDGKAGLKRVYALSYSASNPVKSGFGPYAGGPKIGLVLASKKAIEIYGTGCKDSLGKIPGIGMSQAPSPGKPMTFSGTSSTATQGSWLLFGVDRSKWGALSLPLKLDSLGAPGCTLEVGILLVIPGDHKSGSFATPAWTLPKILSLVGTDLYGQWLLLDPKANKLGFVFSPGLRARIL